MKLKELSAKRFQSLWDVNLELGDLTVIVGPSNSGKSAIGRAVRTVLRNSQSSNFVSHGAKTATLSVTTDAGETITIERGPGTSAYRAILPSGDEEVYVKAGSSVPEDIEKIINLPLTEGEDINLTTQFDGPFLLNEPGGKVSAILGSLTNVTLLAGAAKEANRRRLESQKLAGIRKKDAEQAVITVRSKYSNLAARQQAMEEARTALAEIHDSASRAERLTASAEKAQAALAAQANASAQLEQQHAYVQVLDGNLDELNEKTARLQTLLLALRTWKSAKDSLTQAESAHEAAHSHHQELHEAAEKALSGMDTCPLCNQPLP